jgi:hypothetical protein
MTLVAKVTPKNRQKILKVADKFEKAFQIIQKYSYCKEAPAIKRQRALSNNSLLK